MLPWDRGITRTVLGWMVRGFLMLFAWTISATETPYFLEMLLTVSPLTTLWTSSCWSSPFALPPLPAGITMVLPVRRPSRSDMRFALAMACTVVECLLASE